jgi:galactokinase
LVVDSQAPHNLAVGGEYNARRDSCYSAAKKMWKSSLRDATMADLEGR